MLELGIWCFRHLPTGGTGGGLGGNGSGGGIGVGGPGLGGDGFSGIGFSLLSCRAKSRHLLLLF